MDSTLFDTIVKFVNEQLVFRGLTLEGWTKELSFPKPDEYMDKTSIAKFNSLTIQRAEIIYENVAIAKASYLSAKARYNSNIQAFKTNYIKNIEDNNKASSTSKRLPSADVLETLAATEHKGDYQLLTITEIVYEYWKYQVEKLQLINTRLTSLNISQHNDEKYSN